MRTGQFLNSIGASLGWTACPHCHTVDTRRDCVRCGRQMCASCISHNPAGDEYCALCVDEENQVRREYNLPPAQDLIWACRHGHFDCAPTPGGLCSDEEQSRKRR